MKILILAGGGGTRLFPLSRTCYPKQFLSIAGKESLLSQTMRRFLSIVKPKDIVIITNKDYIFHVQEEIEKLHASGVNVITEPVGRNTAPAIALAMQYCLEKLNCDREEILFVSPSDHLLRPLNSFLKIVQDSEKAANSGNIVTLGVKPTYAETGYGYIEAGNEKIGDTFKVASFKEKPDTVTAQKYLDSGNYYWNSGMFMFKISTLQEELANYAPMIAQLLAEGYDSAICKFSEMPNISIDYAIAEKSKHIVVAPLKNVYWNDIGSFDAIADILGNDQGNTIDGDVRVIDCNNTMILGNNRLITGIGLQDLMVVDTPDVLLVASRGESQKVKNVVNLLKAENRTEVDENVTMYRPWGSYTILSEGAGYKVKRITVKPGNKLSLQMHYHRSEHWTVISGTGKLTLDEKEIIFKENESTYIPIGTRHRLENPGKVPLVIIEVQNGKYLGEDDIVRFDDIYGRVQNTKEE